MPQTSQSIPDALTQFFETSAEPILFTGAGVSMLAGLPDWKNLLLQMAESVRADDPMTTNQMAHYIAKGNLTKAAEFFWLTDEVLVGKKLQTIKNILGSYDSKPLMPLASLPFKGVVTTNFDRSILDAIAGTRSRAPRDYRHGDASFKQALWETELYVARIHGCIEAPQTMVLSESQFDGLLTSDVYSDLLTQIFLHKSVIFLGFSFYDPAIKYIFERVEKRFGPAAVGRHVALLPDGSSSEFIQKANRLNIAVVKYAPADAHQALWKGIRDFADSLKKKSSRTVVSVSHPYSATTQYLAACYARGRVASEHTPLREIVIEGVLSAALQQHLPKSLTTPELHEYIRKALGIKGSDAKELSAAALRELVGAKLVRKHRTEGAKGSRYAWIGNGADSSTLHGAIDTLSKSILNRAYVQEGWKAPQHVADAIALFLKNVIQQRGWDLGAAFASGKAPDTLAFRPVLLECAPQLSAFDRERVERTLESLFQRPTEVESALLGELGRISFALELAFQAPRTTLLHRATLPQRIYFDANLLLPALVEGHQHYGAYGHMLKRLQTASSEAGNRLQLVACSGYLNEMMSHKNTALAYAKEAGDEFESLIKSDALYHGPANINVYIGAYVNWLEGDNPPGFEVFLKKIAPYNTDTDLRRWIEKRGFIVVQAHKNPPYSKIYGVLERCNATKLSNGKTPILVEHDSLQLTLLQADYEKGEKALFVTADRQLYEDVAASELAPLSEFMVSHVGIIQLVDLLVGLKGDERALGEMLWSSNVSDRANRIRSYLTIEALNQYDAALAMGMHQVIEKHTDFINGELGKQTIDLDSHDPKARIRAFKSLGTLESNFFLGMKEAMEKIERAGK